MSAEQQVTVQEQLLQALGVQTLWLRQETPLEEPIVHAASTAAATAGATTAEPVQAPIHPAQQVREQPPSRVTLVQRQAAVSTSVAQSVLTPLDLQGMYLPQVAQRVAACERCGLCETRTQTVFSAGDDQADWMIIGEAPGADEDAQGEPFVGQAGKLLDQMLAAIGRTRSAQLAMTNHGKPSGTVYIANVLKCRPPSNRNPEPSEVAQCTPYLQRQIELINPKLLLLVGKFAAHSILGVDSTIASLRGKVHQVQVNGRNVPAIVTYHPAYLLRNLPEKAKAWEDLCLARAAYEKALQTS